MKHYNILITGSETIQAERNLELLCHRRHCGGDVRIYADEKKFMIGEVANRQNA